MPAPLLPAPPDSARLRRILSHFCTGIVAVTGLDDGKPVGFACQSFSSLSLDPPLILFSVARTSMSWPRMRPTGVFAVNILGDGQEHLSRTFATSGGDKFAGVGWQPGATGAPRLDGALACIECETHAVMDGGDHEIVVGRIVELTEHPHEADPLLYFRSAYRALR